MAEFCLECMRKLDGRDYPEDAFVLSKELDLCEGCGQWKRVVVVPRSRRPLVALVGWIEEAVYQIRHRGEDGRK